MKTKLHLSRLFFICIFATLGVFNIYAESDDDTDQIVFLGQRLNKENGNKIDEKRTWIKEGSVTFDADTRTIIFNNAKIVITEENAPQYFAPSEKKYYPVIAVLRLFCPQKDVNIKFIGDNTIDTPYAGIIMLTFQNDGGVTVKVDGGGTLKFKGKLSAFDFRLYGKLFLNDVNLDLNVEKQYGIWGGGFPNQLEIQDCNIKAKAFGGAVCNFRKLTLTGTKLVSPVNHEPEVPVEDPADDNYTVSTEKGGVTNNAGYPYGEVEFKRTKPQGIEKVEKDKNIKKVKAVYDIYGRRINNLQTGINIVKYSDNTTKKVLK